MKSRQAAPTWAVRCHSDIEFVADIPNGQAVNPVTGGSWEGVGIKPDVEVPAAQAPGKAHEVRTRRQGVRAKLGPELHYGQVGIPRPNKKVIA